jgi:uncharacterized membrane protein YqjE
MGLVLVVLVAAALVSLLVSSAVSRQRRWAILALVVSLPVVAGLAAIWSLYR